jgi:uncharacterized iron-regulated membrane protein
MGTILLAFAGVLVTAMVVAGMVLIAPAGTEDVHAVGEPSHGSNLSPVGEAVAGPGEG